MVAQVCNHSVSRLSQNYNFEDSLGHIVRLFPKTETKGGSGWGHKCYHRNSFINRYFRMHWIPLLVSKSTIIALDFIWTHCFSFLITPVAGHSLPPDSPDRGMNRQRILDTLDSFHPDFLFSRTRWPAKTERTWSGDSLTAFFPHLVLNKLSAKTFDSCDISNRVISSWRGSPSSFLPSPFPPKSYNLHPRETIHNLLKDKLSVWMLPFSFVKFGIWSVWPNCC